MNLTTLIPDSASFSATFEPVTGGGGQGLAGLADLIQSQDFASTAESLGTMLLDRVDTAIPSADGLPFTGAIQTLTSLGGLAGSPPSDLTSAVQRPLSEI